MYWGVAKQFGGQELWRELLQVRRVPRMQETCCSQGLRLVWWLFRGERVVSTLLLGTVMLSRHRAVEGFVWCASATV